MKIVEQMNKEYIDLINSNEYKTGKYISYIKKELKSRDPKRIAAMISRIHMLSKLKVLSRKRTYKRTDNQNVELKKKVAVYTVLFGNYDKVNDPYYVDDNCDYFLITDSDADHNVWNKIVLSDNEKKAISSMNNTQKNRYFKMIGPELLKNYDYAIYLDSNIDIYGPVSKLVNCINEKTGLALFNHSSRGRIDQEVKSCILQKKGNKENLLGQLRSYEEKGFPFDFGLYECCVIVKDLHNNNEAKIMDDWWNDFNRQKSKRDQISFPFVLWENGYKFTDVGILGDNIYKDSLFRKREHL